MTCTWTSKYLRKIRSSEYNVHTNAIIFGGSFRLCFLRKWIQSKLSDTSYIHTWTSHQRRANAGSKFLLCLLSSKAKTRFVFNCTAHNHSSGFTIRLNVSKRKGWRTVDTGVSCYYIHNIATFSSSKRHHHAWRWCVICIFYWIWQTC